VYVVLIVNNPLISIYDNLFVNNMLRMFDAFILNYLLSMNDVFVVYLFVKQNFDDKLNKLKQYIQEAQNLQIIVCH
jgi:hypothetical protein